MSCVPPLSCGASISEIDLTYITCTASMGTLRVLGADGARKWDLSGNQCNSMVVITNFIDVRRRSVRWFTWLPFFFWPCAAEKKSKGGFGGLAPRQFKC